jgi:hypothetical protein
MGKRFFSTSEHPAQFQTSPGFYPMDAAGSLSEGKAAITT